MTARLITLVIVMVAIAIWLASCASPDRRSVAEQWCDYLQVPEKNCIH